MLVYSLCFTMVLACNSYLFGQAGILSFDQYAQSFIEHYNFVPEGRFAHEYHPAMLDATSKSFDKIEIALVQEGVKLAGRMVILGYEEQAAPSYYTNYAQPRINDESIIRTKAGWSMRLHNRFGLMSGFLFRSCQTSPLFEHIHNEDMTLFASKADIFQQHAFGSILPVMIITERKMQQSCLHGDTTRMLNTLIDFWKLLHEGKMKVGNFQLAGTQDVLFSIAYAQYLTRSSLPITHWWTGPDITYPIEVTRKQHRDATRHAQTFVKRLSK